MHLPCTKFLKHTVLLRQELQFLEHKLEIFNYAQRRIKLESKRAYDTAVERGTAKQQVRIGQAAAGGRAKVGWVVGWWSSGDEHVAPHG
jgi:hypothetical protein